MVKFPGSFSTKKLSFPELKNLQAKLLSPSKEKGVGTGGAVIKLSVNGGGPRKILPSTMLGGKKTSGKKTTFRKLQNINLNSIQLETFLKWHLVICEYESWSPTSPILEWDFPKILSYILHNPENRKQSSSGLKMLPSLWGSMTCQYWGHQPRREISHIMIGASAHPNKNRINKPVTVDEQTPANQLLEQHNTSEFIRIHSRDLPCQH